MQLGKVIREYRKKKGMTQEEMAFRLGVTAPAVNKWENGNSLPDITLLAPIARLLAVPLDTLLSFRENLTDGEVAGLVSEANAMLKEKPYGEAFQWAKEMLEQYPGCAQLAWQMAAVLEAQLLRQEPPGSEGYKSYIHALYTRALESDDEAVRMRAAGALARHYLGKQEYARAEGCLEYFSMQNPERKRMQAEIYSSAGRTGEASKAYEELLFGIFQTASAALHGLYLLALQEGDRERAHMLAGKQAELARCFEMGEYYEASCQLELAILEEDAEAAFLAAKAMLSNVGGLTPSGTRPFMRIWNSARQARKPKRKWKKYCVIPSGMWDAMRFWGRMEDGASWCGNRGCKGKALAQAWLPQEKAPCF